MPAVKRESPAGFGRQQFTQVLRVAVARDGPDDVAGDVPAEQNRRLHLGERDFDLGLALAVDHLRGDPGFRCGRSVDDRQVDRALFRECDALQFDRLGGGRGCERDKTRQDDGRGRFLAKHSLFLQSRRT